MVKLIRFKNSTIRKIKLRLSDLKNIINSIQSYISRKTCPHILLPVKLNNKPGELCSICDFSKNITPEEFFSKYGEDKFSQLGNIR